MISQLERPTQEQTAHLDFAESLRQAVIEETDNGRRIIRTVASIMDGDAPNCTPWHQLEAAKLLRKLGIGNTSFALSLSKGPHKPPLPHQPVIPTEHVLDPDRGAGIQSGEDAAGESENPPHPVHPVSPGPDASDEHTKFNKKLVRQVRIHTGDGASIVRYLTEIMEGQDPTTKGRDRLEAIRMLLGICLNSPSFPDAEFMMQAVRCHPDCFCVCEGLPEDHPEVVKMHTPLTAEQREQLAEQQAQQEEWDRQTDEHIERKQRADREWKLMEFRNPEAVADRRIEREEQRKRRKEKKDREEEQERQCKRDRIEQISRETRMELWQAHQHETERRTEKERHHNRSP